MASDSEFGDVDYDALQQRLLQQLDSCLDERLADEDTKSRAKNKDKKKKRKDRDGVRGHKTASQTADHNTIAMVGKIREMTSIAKRDRELNSTNKLHKDELKSKLDGILSKASISSHKDPEPQITPDLSDQSESEAEGDFPEEDFDEVDSEDGGFGDESYSDAEADSCDEADDDDGQIISCKAKGQLEKFKRALGISENDLKCAREDRILAEEAKQHSEVTLVETFGSRARKRKTAPEVVIFDDPAKKKKKKSVKNVPLVEEPLKSKPSRSSSGSVEFDMLRARHDVRRFGIDGLKGKDKEKGMIDLMINLGAKPPKNECVNYKNFQKQRKDEMKAELEKREMDRKMGFKVAKKRKRIVKDRNDVGALDGQIGAYRDGVQVLTKKAIEKINKEGGRKR